MDLFIDQLVTQIINSYNKYMNKLHDASIARALLHNSLDLLGLEEHSKLVYDQKVNSHDARKQRFKININGFKLVNNLHENEHYLEQNKELVYSSDIYFQQRQIVETNFYTPDELANVFFDVEFEVDSGLSTGFFEFRFFTTSPTIQSKEERNVSKPIKTINKKDQLINFSDTESIDNYNDIKSGAGNLGSHNRRNSNPFETTTRAKSNTDNEIRDIQNLQNFSNQDEIQNLNDYHINNEDIKLEFENNPSKESQNSNQMRSRELNSGNTDPNSKANIMSKLVKSPIKEVNEEDEFSRQGTPTQSLTVPNTDQNAAIDSGNNPMHRDKQKG